MPFKAFSFKSMLITGLGLIWVHESSIPEYFNLKSVVHSLFSKSTIISKITHSPSVAPTPNVTPKPSRSVMPIEPIISPDKTPPVKPKSLNSSSSSSLSIEQISSNSGQYEVVSSIALEPQAVSNSNPTRKGATARLVPKSEVINSPVFNSLGELQRAGELINRLSSSGSESVDLRFFVSAYFNPEQKTILVSSTDNSFLGKLNRSLYSKLNSFWTISGERISSSEQIIFAEKSAVEWLNSVPVIKEVNPTYIESTGTRGRLSFLGIGSKEREPKILELKDLNPNVSGVDTKNYIGLSEHRLYTNSLESFGDIWVPIMISTKRQPSSTLLRTLGFDLHLFKENSILSNLAKEIITIDRITIILENFSTHVNMNPYFLGANIVPFKVPKPLYTTIPIETIESIITQASFRISSFSQRARDYFGSLLVAAELRVDKANIIKSIFVYEGSILSEFLNQNKGASITLGGKTIPHIIDSSEKKYLLNMTLKDANKVLAGLENNPWSLSNAIERASKGASKPIAKSGIIAFLEHRPFSKSPHHKQLVTTFFPFFEELDITVNSIPLSRSMYLSEGPYSSVVRYVSQRNQVPRLEAVPDYSKTIEFNPNYLILEKDIGTEFLPKSALRLNLKLSPVFKDFNELSILSEHLYSDVLKLSKSNSDFVRITPVALYHPANNEIAVLDNSVFAHLYTRLSSTLESIEFTNGFKPSKISIYARDEFYSLSGEQNILGLLEKSSFKESFQYFHSNKWNLLLVGLGDNLPDISQQVVINLFEESIMFKNIFTKSYLLSKEKWSYELLSRETTPSLLPLFSSHSDLISSVSPLKELLKLGHSAQLRVTALYNKSSQSVIVSDQENSFLSVLLRSISESNGENFLTIGTTKINPENIIFAKGNALDYILNRNVPNPSSIVVNITEDRLFQSHLLHHNKWMPITATWENSLERGIYPILPDIYLFDDIHVYRGLGKEVYSPLNGTRPITLENYTKHLFFNSEFLNDVMPLKLNKGVYSNPTEAQPFISEVSLSKHHLSEGARYHLGDLMISGVFNYKLDRAYIELQVLNGSRLSDFIKSTSFQSVKLSENSINVSFKDSPSLVLGQPVTTRVWIGNVGFSLETFPYTFNNLYNLSLHNELISGIQIPAFIEHSTSRLHPLLTSYKFPVYPTLKDLKLLSISLSNEQSVLSKNISGVNYIREIPYVTISDLNNQIPHEQALISSTSDLQLRAPILTRSFKSFEELSYVSQMHYKISVINKNPSVEQTVPFLKLYPVAIYQPSTNKVGLLEGSFVFRVYNNRLASASSDNRPIGSQITVIRIPVGFFKYVNPEIEIFGHQKFFSLSKYKTISSFQELHPKHYELSKMPLEAWNEWIPIFAEPSYPKYIIDEKIILSLFHRLEFMGKFPAFTNIKWLNYP